MTDKSLEVYRVVGVDAWTHEAQETVLIEAETTEGSEFNLVIPGSIARGLLDDLHMVLDEPNPGRMYRLTGGYGETCIRNGHAPAESLVG